MQFLKCVDQILIFPKLLKQRNKLFEGVNDNNSNQSKALQTKLSTKSFYLYNSSKAVFVLQENFN